MNDRISIVIEQIEERNAEINARIDGGRTPLGWARNEDKLDIAAYLFSRGGIV